ncbi:hypothetical protein ACWEFJ_19270 [Actinosynnema sp. NPDC004786]
MPHVACFDTAFHHTLPAAASTHPLPGEWRERWDLRRYGFHGLSHSYASRRAVRPAGGGRRVVTCHLGAGCSLAAVHDGRSVDTTVGFTPMGGVPMATRPGDLDPGLDVLVFTGVVGEHDAELRARVVEGLAFLGVTVDDDADLAASGDAAIGAGVWVVTAREDVEIAAGARSALAVR